MVVSRDVTVGNTAIGQATEAMAVLPVETDATHHGGVAANPTHLEPERGAGLLPKGKLAHRQIRGLWLPGQAHIRDHGVQAGGEREVRGANEEEPVLRAVIEVLYA